MILAFNNLIVNDNVQTNLVEIFDLNNKKLCSKKFSVEISKKNKNDILLQIKNTLSDVSIDIKEITKIYFCNGKGRYTAVRTACIVANFLSKELSIDLYTFTYEEFLKSDNFSKIINNYKIKKSQFAHCIF